jgi:hypothetical protein
MAMNTVTIESLIMMVVMIPMMITNGKNDTDYDCVGVGDDAFFGMTMSMLMPMILNDDNADSNNVFFND